MRKRSKTQQNLHKQSFRLNKYQIIQHFTWKLVHVVLMSPSAILNLVAVTGGLGPIQRSGIVCPICHEN